MEYYEGGPKTWNEAFPPICVKPRGDPTLVADRVLPKYQHSMTLDPRPSTKVCVAYHTQPTDTTVVHEKGVLPPGGAPRMGSPYMDVAAESAIFRLNEPLTRCSERRYIPNGGLPSPAISTNVLPGSEQPVSPHVGVFSCRAEDDLAAWNRSSKLFFNHTLYDRTR